MIRLVVSVTISALMSANDVAEAHQARLGQIIDRAEGRAGRLWSRMDFTDLDGSWSAIAGEVTARATAAQLAAVKAADRYTNQLTAAYDFDAMSARIDPEAFVGVDGSGRPLESLLRGAVTTTKEAVGAGLGPRAMEAGATYLAAMLSTAVADISRTANQVSGISKGYSSFARVVEPGACSRCIVLAGATQFGPFKRHPRCRCTVQPIAGGSDFAEGPEGVFGAMSKAEQDRVFGAGSAQSIREGADLISVVTARRGAMRGIGTAGKGIRPAQLRKTTVGYRADGSAIRVYTTSEGTTVRGAFGRSNQALGTVRINGSRYSSVSRIRLMPESIMELTTDSAERRILLQDAGYFTPRGLNTGAEIVANAADNRAKANDIFTRLGVSL